MKQPKTIMWFRQDLRLHDNPALTAAIQQGDVLPIYILDDDAAGEHQLGGASRWWLHHSLASLHQSLSGTLSFYRGNASDIIAQLIEHYPIEAVYWNRCYEPWRQHRDQQIKSMLQDHGITVDSFNGSLLWEPWTIKKTDGTHYRVFTPFYRKGCLAATPPRWPLAKAEGNTLAETHIAVPLAALELTPKHPWGDTLARHWTIGETAAQDKLTDFIANGLNGYKTQRNFPTQPHVSKLSPHLHFGEISPNTVWHAIRGVGISSDIDHFCSELGWREFSYSQLFYSPDLPTKNLQSKFDAFPWGDNTAALQAWQRGETGIPMVDAGMRELWQTGSMHNRVRMITGSFLVKNLLLHWHHGAQWFWDTLVDADLASNSASWQWVAGCGADAAPYFRIFNPVTQGQKFDPTGEYIRHYVPEIAHLPDQYLYNPWEAPKSVQEAAQVVLGKTYPHPIVDLKASRQAALAAFQTLKQMAP